MRYNRIIALAALLTLGASCKQYEDMPQGDRYPSTAITQATQEVRQLLRSSEQGWLLTLVPDGGTYGGRAIILKFTSPTAVTMLSEEDIRSAGAGGAGAAEGSLVAGEETSTYHFSQNGGIRLTFDTFNEQLHRYSDPGWGLPVGYNGDKDFIIEEISEDRNTITLRGGRTQGLMTLERLSQDPSEYVVKVSEMRQKLQSRALSPLTLGGQEVSISIFTFARKLWVRYGEVSANIPIVFTDRGLKLLEPLTIGGETLTELILDESEETMHANGSTQALELYAGRYDLTRGFMRLRYNDDTYASSAAYGDLMRMNEIQQSSAYPGSFGPSFWLGKSNSWDPRVLMQINIPAYYSDYASHFLDFAPVYGAPNEVHIIRGIQYGQAWLWTYDAMDSFLNAFLSHSPFEIRPAGTEYPDNAYLVSVADPSGYWIWGDVPYSY